MMSNITRTISPEEPLRWMDQKVTYDNLRTIAASVNSVVGCTDDEFTWKDIRDSRSLQRHVEKFYGKPGLENLSAINEYDKFIGQPLQTLAFAGALDSSIVGRQRVFRIVDRELLREVSRTDIDAFDFLVCYLEVTLEAAGWMYNLNAFIDGPKDEQAFRALRESFITFMIDHSRIGTRNSADPTVEIRRIFPKVINPICLNRGSRGVVRGRLSKDIIQMSDLTYNRPNFRDVKSGKSKGMTRSEYELIRVAERKGALSSMSKVMRLVRDYHNGHSEVPTASGVRASHVHHMFPKADFPELADVRENLIALTPGQHLGEAHPNGNTSVVDPIYRKTCLYQKLESIRISTHNEDGFYSYGGLARVLERGFSTEVIEPSYEALRKVIRSFS